MGNARDQASGLQTKSLKEQTKTHSRQVKFKSYLFQGQAGTEVFLSPDKVWFSGFPAWNMATISISVLLIHIL